MRLPKTIKLFRTNRKNVLLPAILVLGSLIFTVFAVTTSLNAANAGDTVQVVNTAGGADLLDIPTSTQIVGPDGCPMIALPYNPARDIACAAGHMRAQEINEKINDIWQWGLNPINHRIDRLNQTIEYLKRFSATDLDGLTLVAVPAGDLSKEVPHITVASSSISMKCLTPPEPMGPSAVGKQVNYNNEGFNPLPMEALRALKTLIDDNNRIKEIVASGFHFVLGIPTLPTIAKFNEMARITYRDQLLTARLFIPVTYLEEGEANFSGVRISYIPDEKGNKQIKNFGMITRKMAKNSFPELPNTGTIARLDGAISLNGVIDGITYSTSSIVDYKTPFPDSFVFNLLNKSVDEHMKEYQRLKAELETERQTLQVELDALTTNNFNCN